MTNATYVQAVALKTTINYLNDLKLELQDEANQTVIVLKKRKLPSLPPTALTGALAAMETNLVAQALVLFENQISTFQDEFDQL